MNIYRDIMPRTGGYLSDKNGIHLPRLELYIQELARREPLYFQQRAVDEKEPNYADDGYKNFYYKVSGKETITSVFVLTICFYVDICINMLLSCCDILRWLYNRT